MQSLIQANIFFFITSIAVILVTILAVVILMYIVLVLKDFRGISSKIREETDLIAMDINEARAHIRKEGVKAGFVFNFFKQLFKKQKSTKKSAH